LSADEKARDMYERRLKSQRDEAMFADGARAEGEQRGEQKGRADVARNLLQMNLPIEQIITATGLTREEIEAL
jgi:predicted transposase/invertase (TIGR01784 family)